MKNLVLVGGRSSVRGLFLAVVVGCGCVGSVAGATLTAVPMQGGMAMPMVSYLAEHGHLHVMMPAAVPQLTPLLVSHAADGFDPADPWFDSLDPSRRGLAFSRRYGFVMDAMSDPLPENTAIWIRKLAGSPELEFYRYAASLPKAWQPIFGTAGAPEAMFWSGMMFHPAVAAPAGTNLLSATFEAYLVDTTTGLEVADSGSGLLVFDFTNVPDGRPGLDLGSRPEAGGGLVLTWPVGTSGYELEWAESLTSPAWMPVTNQVQVLEGQPAVVLDPEGPMMFLRMRKLP